MTIRALSGSLPLVVVGSVSFDAVFRVPRLPVRDGEVFADASGSYHGGSGANVACHAAALMPPGRVHLLSATSADRAGQELVAELTRRRVQTQLVKRMVGERPCHHGIMADRNGHRMIAVFSGAMKALEARADWLRRVRRFEDVYMAPASPELLVRTWQCFGPGARIIWNPGSALFDDSHRSELRACLRKTDVLIVNREEARIYSGAKTTARAARWFAEQGVGRAIVITQDIQGALVMSREQGVRSFRTAPVKTIHAVGAGDAFGGAMAAGMMQGMGLLSALVLGCVVARIQVRAEGVRSFVPTYNEAISEIDFLLSSKARKETPERSRVEMRHVRTRLLGLVGHRRIARSRAELTIAVREN